MSTKKCCVPLCEQNAHARGYCRKHYGRMWRGKELEPSRTVLRPPEGCREETLYDAEKELMEMRRIYDHVVGFESRMRWSRKIHDCETMIVQLKEREQKAMSVMSATG